MQAEWKIQLNDTTFGCYNQQLTIDMAEETRLATDEEYHTFLTTIMTIEIDELKEAYLIERLDLFREHLKALNFEIEFFHSWNEASSNSYSEYAKIYHATKQEITACYKQITLQTIKNNEIVDQVGALETIEALQYDVAKDAKIGSIKLQLLDMGITEMKA